MIPIAKCKHGFLYAIEARNFYIGVFMAGDPNSEISWKKTPRFIGVRQKFHDEFLDQEDHWEIGPPHGTAKPIKELEPAIAADENSKELLDWLKEKEKEYSDWTDEEVQVARFHEKLKKEREEKERE